MIVTVTGSGLAADQRKAGREVGADGDLVDADGPGRLTSRSTNRSRPSSRSRSAIEPPMDDQDPVDRGHVAHDRPWPRRARLRPRRCASRSTGRSVTVTLTSAAEGVHARRQVEVGRGLTFDVAPVDRDGASVSSRPQGQQVVDVALDGDHERIDGHAATSKPAAGDADDDRRGRAAVLVWPSLKIAIRTWADDGSTSTGDSCSPRASTGEQVHDAVEVDARRRRSEIRAWTAGHAVRRARLGPATVTVDGVDDRLADVEAGWAPARSRDPDGHERG